MRDGLIITAIGKDRPGLVDRVTGRIYEEGGNLEDSRMAILGDAFSLMVLVTGTGAQLRAIENSLSALATELDLTIQARGTQTDPGEDVAVSPAPRLPYRLSVVAMDHPGIVHQITHTLALNGVNVATLETRLSRAPTTGTPVFALELEAQVPADLPIAGLRSELERLAGESNLDVDLRAIS